MIGKIDVNDGKEKAVFMVNPNGVNLIKNGIENYYAGSVTISRYDHTIIRPLISGNSLI